MILSNPNIMCGIFCFSSNEEINSNTGVNGLKKLEYRGYDSFGAFQINNNKENLTKEIGEVEKFSFPEEIKTKYFLSHTRWATHGKVTKENSHPHLSNDSNIIIVHNGIIENFQELKDSLVYKGYKFKSQTDTEVISNLIQEELTTQNNFLQATNKVCKKITGRYSFVAFNVKTKEMIGVRNGSPLIVGKKGNSIFISSDAPAFFDITNTVSYIDDGQIAYINQKLNQNCIFYKLNSLEEIYKKEIKLEIENQKIHKKNFKHYMLKEIMEQKHTIKRAIETNKEAITKLANLINKKKKVYFIGCGTSAFVGQSSKYIFHDIANLKTDFEISSEFKSIQNFIDKDTIVIGLSQSGETIDTIEALEIAKSKGATTACIVNNENSTMFRICDTAIPVKAGTEIAVASTKSTTSKMAILILTAYSCINKQKIGFNELIRNQALINDMLNPGFEEHIIKIAKKFFHHKHMFVIGKGYNFTVALEGALKIKELSYINTQAFQAGELKHGSIALIEKGTPVIAIAPNDCNQNDVLTSAHEIKSRGGVIIGLSENKSEVFDEFIKVPNCKEGNLMAYTIPLQIFSYHLANFNKFNPDKPRNLAKSVTVK